MSDRKAPREKLTLDPESETWSTLPWRKLEQHVFRIQKRIYQASQRGNQRAVQKLQKLLMKSEAARLLAVRQVTQSKQGKKTAGRDGGSPMPAERKAALVQYIHPRQWKRQKPQPASRRSLPDSGKTERRPSGILSARDQARQVLARQALEPEWEARFEPNSYGFRPGRSCEDAIMAIWEDLRWQDKYVLSVSLNGCFDHLNSEALLQTLQAFPGLKQAIKAWLHASMMDHGAYISASQENGLAPLLINIALHGLETCLTQTFSGQDGYAQMVRYADNFVIFHPTLAGINQARERVEQWLQNRGLALQADQITITHTLRPYQGKVGFDFLGWTIRHYAAGKNQAGRPAVSRPLDCKISIRPSKENVQRHMQAVEKVINENVASSQETLIRQLTPVIRDWTTTYKMMGAADEFSRCDHLLWWQLWRWGKKRHPHKGQGWRKERYWQSDENRQWIFGTPDGIELRQHARTSIQRHQKVCGTASPYDGNVLYWSQRIKPLLPSTQAKRLQEQKQAKGRWCELLSTHEEDMLIDSLQTPDAGGRKHRDNA